MDIESNPEAITFAPAPEAEFVTEGSEQNDNKSPVADPGPLAPAPNDEMVLNDRVTKR